MEIRTRRFLFYSALIVFLLLGYGLVVYALGYRYDFIRGKFQKTGSLQVQTNINANVYLNDELAGETSFLTNSFAKSRLLPRTYVVRIQRRDSQSWQKNVDVEAGVLINHPKVVLLPLKFKEEIAAFGAFNANRLSPKTPKTRKIVSPDGDKSATFNEREIFVEWLENSGRQPFRKTGDVELITRFSQTIRDIQWYKDSEHLIVDAGGILKFIEIDIRGGINIFDITGLDGPFYYDQSDNAIYKLDGDRAVKINLTR